MAKVGHGVGLSVDAGDGKWMLRWRQDEEQSDGTLKRVQRTKTVFTIEELRHFTAEIEAALRAQGWWRPDGRPSAMPMIANAELAAFDWVAWKVGTRGASENTRGNLARAMKRFFTELRELTGVAPDAAIPVTALTSANLNAVTARWRDRFAPGTVYQTMAAVVDMWGWIADDPGRNCTPRSLTRSSTPDGSSARRCTPTRWRRMPGSSRARRCRCWSTRKSGTPEPAPRASRATAARASCAGSTSGRHTVP